MKYLAAFDFDYTITDDYSLQAFRSASHVPITEAQKMLTEVSTDILNYATKNYAKLKEHGYNIHSIFHALRSVEVAPGMDIVLKYLKENGCEVVVTTDNLSLIVEEWLKIHNFSDVFKKVCALPSRVTEQDDLVVEAYNNHDCGISHKSMCKGQALQSYIEERKAQGVTFSGVWYFGDSFTDLCPVLRLSENDIAFPRKDFVLDKMIQENTDPRISQIKANVRPWTSGLDVIEVLKEKL